MDCTCTGTQEVNSEEGEEGRKYREKESEKRQKMKGEEKEELWRNGGKGVGSLISRSHHGEGIHVQ